MPSFPQDLHLTNLILNAEGWMQADTFHIGCKYQTACPPPSQSYSHESPNCTEVFTESLIWTPSVHHQTWSDVGEVLSKPVCTHITGDPQRLCDCVHGLYTRLLGIPITSVPVSLECLRICVTTLDVAGQYITLYFPNRVSLLSHILCAVVYQL